MTTPAELLSAIPLASLVPLISFMRRDRSIEHWFPDAPEDLEGLPAQQPSIPQAASSIQRLSGLDGFGFKSTGIYTRINDEFYALDDPRIVQTIKWDGFGKVDLTYRLKDAASPLAASGNTEAGTGDSTANSQSKKSKSSSPSPKRKRRGQVKAAGPRSSPPTSPRGSAAKNSRRRK